MLCLNSFELMIMNPLETFGIVPVDFSDLLNFDLEIIKACIEAGKKKNALTHLYKSLKQ